MESKIRIKMGPIEVEYEGSEAFLKDELPQFLEAVSKLYAGSGGSGLLLPGPGSGNGDKDDGTHAQPSVGTTSAIATRLGTKSGPDLIVAAAAQLSIVSGKTSFTRAELLAEMRTAQSFYRKTYRNNLTGYLTTLQKEKKLNEGSKNNFALTADFQQELRTKLA